MTAEVEPVRQATTRELSYERKQQERESRETTLVTPCTLHPHNSVRISAHPAQLSQEPRGYATTVNIHSLLQRSSKATRKIR
jgi:hypothetical protein